MRLIFNSSFLTILSLAFFTACNPKFQIKPNYLTPKVGDSQGDGDSSQGDEAIIEPPPSEETSIEDRYPFLKDSSFHTRLKEIQPIPANKNCSNAFSYSYLGTARLVSQYIFGDFPHMFFSQSGPRFIPYFSGYPADISEEELFGPSNLLKDINSTHSELLNLLQLPLTLSSITKSSHFDHDHHCRHRAGTAIDIRPLPGERPITWRSKDYDFQKNLEFVKQLLKRKEVYVIFFNDPNIYNHNAIQELLKQRTKDNWLTVYRTNVRGHDNHYHIEFALHPDVHEVTEYIFSQTDLSPASSFIQSIYSDFELKSH